MVGVEGPRKDASLPLIIKFVEQVDQSGRLALIECVGSCLDSKAILEHLPKISFSSVNPSQFSA